VFDLRHEQATNVQAFGKTVVVSGKRHSAWMAVFACQCFVGERSRMVDTGVADINLFAGVGKRST